MVLHLGRSSAELQEQTREARRFLMSQTRNDWWYPDAPHVLPWDRPTTPSSSSSTAAVVAAAAAAAAAPNARAQVNAHTSQVPASLPADFQVQSWRERTYSSGESGASDNEACFEGPDDVAPAIAAKKATRKRKRQERLEEEMNWNVGLAHWSARRNVWTRAQKKDAAGEATPTAAPGAEDAAVLLPVAPPLLPTHPVRSRITTATYSDIYTKITLQGRTPSIPINLQDMTRSLVHGWKEEGNWPPKPAPPEPSFSRRGRGGEGRGHPHLRKGVQAVGRVLGFGGPVVPVEAGPAKRQI